MLLVQLVDFLYMEHQSSEKCSSAETGSVDEGKLLLFKHNF